MKKLTLFLLFSCLIAFTATASNNLPKGKFINPKTKKELIKFGRECCTVTIGIPGQGTVSSTACAGWFLSNSDAAMGRACDKARSTMLQAFM